MGEEPEFSILAPEATDRFTEMVSIYQEAIIALRAEISRRDWRTCCGTPATGFSWAAFQAARWASRSASFHRVGASGCWSTWRSIAPLRSGGYGRIFFFAAKRLAADVAGAFPCVLEVDQPPMPPAADSEQSRRLAVLRAHWVPQGRRAQLHLAAGRRRHAAADVAAGARHGRSRERCPRLTSQAGSRRSTSRSTVSSPMTRVSAEMLSYANHMHELKLEPLT